MSIPIANCRHLRRQRSRHTAQITSTVLAPWSAYFDHRKSTKVTLTPAICLWAGAMQTGCSINWAIMKQLTEAVSRTHPGAITHLYGSHAMTMQLPSSDYDVAVQVKDKKMSNDELRGALHHHVTIAGWKATSSPFAKVVGVVQDGLKVEVSVATEALNHVKAAHILVSSVFCKQMPLLRPVMLILKQFLRSCHLDAKLGGLRSWGLVLMVATVMYDEPEDSESALKLFLRRFLRALADDEGHAVVVREGRGGARRLALATMKRRDMEFAEILVQDPLTAANVERSCHKWAGVQKAFAHLQRALLWHIFVHKRLRNAFDVQRVLLSDSKVRCSTSLSDEDMRF